MRKHIAAALAFCLALTAFAQTKPAAVITGYAMGSSPAAATVTADGKTAIVAGNDKTLRFFDLATGNETKKATIGNEPSVIGVTADGKNITIAGNRGPLQLLDAEGKLVKELARDTNGGAISPDGKIVATTVVGGPTAVTLFSVPGGTKLAEVTIPREAASLSFSADGSLLAIGLFEGTDNVLLADAKTGQIKAKFQHGGKQVSVALSPDGNTIASNGAFPQNEGLMLFDVKTGKGTPVPGVKFDNARLAFYPDGKMLAYAEARLVKSVDVAGAKVIGPITSQGEMGRILLITKDKKLLRGQPGTLEVWDLSKP